MTVPNHTSSRLTAGDRITFRSPTRYTDRAATRIVNGFYHDQPTVRYAGCANFIVRRAEISAVNGAAL